MKFEQLLKYEGVQRIVQLAKDHQMGDLAIIPPINSEDENYLVQQYVNAFTAKTKVVNITHIINWNGQILPVKKIAQEAHQRGIEVVVDGAHSFAHFDFKIPDLECDYFGTSLHKFLSAPIGSGMLWIKKEKIERHKCPNDARFQDQKEHEIGFHVFVDRPTGEHGQDRHR